MRSLQALKGSKHKVSVFALMFAACMLLFLSGCQAPVGPQDTAVVGTGSVSLRVESPGMGRAIMPDTMLEDFVNFTITFPGGVVEDLDWDYEVVDNVSSISINATLPVGTWNLTITAYLPGEYGSPYLPAARVVIPNIVVVAGANTAVPSAVLLPIRGTSYSGTFSWDITFPSFVTGGYIHILTPAGADTEHVPVELPTPVSSPWIDSIPLPASDYFVVFVLNAGDRIATAAEDLHVYRNMESHFEFEFVDGDFALYVPVESVTITGNGVVPGAEPRQFVLPMTAGDSVVLAADVLPLDATFGSPVIWAVTTGDENVTWNGTTLTAVRAGSATLTATAGRTPIVTSTLTVTVAPRLVPLGNFISFGPGLSPPDWHDNAIVGIDSSDTIGPIVGFVGPAGTWIQNEAGALLLQQTGRTENWHGVNLNPDEFGLQERDILIIRGRAYSTEPVWARAELQYAIPAAYDDSIQDESGWRDFVLEWIVPAGDWSTAEDDNVRVIINDGDNDGNTYTFHIYSIEVQRPAQIIVGTHDNGSFTHSPTGWVRAGTEVILTVTPNPRFVFDGWNIEGITPAPRVGYPNQWTFIMPPANVTINAVFVLDPLRDLAYGSTAENARASAIRVSLPLAPIEQAFDGDIDSFAQIQGEADLAHWFAVDLGAEYDIEVVRIVWGMSGAGSTGDHNGMVRFAVQTSNTLTELPAAGTYENDGWTEVRVVANPGNDGVNIRNAQNRVNTIILDAPVTARFVRIKQLADFNTTPQGPNATWTNWPAISMFQVFATGYENVPSLTVPIHNKFIGAPNNRIEPPVWRATPPAIGTNFAPPYVGYTAVLTGISPAVDGVFSPDQVYTFTFTLQTTGSNVFTSALPTIHLGAPFLAAPQTTVLVSTDGDPITEMVVTRAFAATESDVIDAVAFTLVAPFMGGPVPTEANLAPADAFYSGTIEIERSSDNVNWTVFTGTTFEPGYHRFNITLTADTDYVFYENIELPLVAGVEPGNIVHSGTSISFTVTFGAIAADALLVTTTGELTTAGLTARAYVVSGGVNTDTAPFEEGDTVQIRVLVTGAATVGTIFTAQLQSSEVAEFNFRSGFDVGMARPSSRTRSRNIGVETIGSVPQPYSDWTFVFDFVMPDVSVTINLVDTFRTDIAPTILYGNPSQVRVSTVNAGGGGSRVGMNMFNGVYNLGGSDNDNRWESVTGPGNWVAVDLGAVYSISDIVIRWNGGLGAPRRFFIDVSSDQAAWDALPPEATGSGDRPGGDLWTDGWTVRSGRQVDGGAASSALYVPLLVGSGQPDFSMLTTRAARAIGPYPPAAGPLDIDGAEYRAMNFANTELASGPLVGRFIRLHISLRQGMDQANSIINFEIYGTRVDP
ncbi:MAG: discoidin domain-containing protein [Treponema sp.]|nr:discoidin domain-containing protein [Treponema sp.]